jgi:predicted nucleic acid-binding protein
MKPVLVDTSVWRRYFAGSETVRQLGDLLDEDDAVLLHPFVIGEMVLGGLSTHEEKLVRQLPSAALVSHDEVLAMVRTRRLMRRGIGWVDAHLIASALVSSALLWTVDVALAAAASDVKVSFRAG